MKTNQTKKDGDNYLALGIGVGLCLGAGIGHLLGDVGLGLALGMLVGVAIGILFDSQNREKTQNTPGE